MIKIRLQRVGRRNDPYFRLVAVDSRRGPKSGNFLEILGVYNPRAGVPQIKADRVKKWLASGGQVSDTAYNLLVSRQIIPGPKRAKKISHKKKAKSTTTPVDTAAA